MLTSLPYLQYLDIRNTKVDFYGHKHLSNLTALQGLQLTGRITNDNPIGYAHDIAVLRLLWRLSLLTHLRLGPMR